MQTLDRRKSLIQTILLTLWSFLIVFPKIYSDGFNIVTDTYAEAAQRLIAGLNPYLSHPAKGDVFLNSPLFGILFFPFTLLPQPFAALLWVFLNAFVFWLGISCWFSFKKKMPAMLWIGFIAASMELDGALRYQQVNPMVVGLTLMALRFAGTLGGTFLSLATVFKFLPAVFMPQFFLENKKNAVALALSFVGFLMAPTLLLGFSKNIEFLISYFNFVISESSLRHILDIKTVLEHYGFSTLASVTKLFVAVVSICFLVIAPLLKLKLETKYWVALGFSTALLLSPRTESPTFVLIAPAYLFLALESSLFARLILIAAQILISLEFNSLVPESIRRMLNHGNDTKTLGVLLIWGYVVFQCTEIWKPIQLRLHKIIG